MTVDAPLIKDVLPQLPLHIRFSQEGFEQIDPDIIELLVERLPGVRCRDLDRFSEDEQHVRLGLYDNRHWYQLFEPGSRRPNIDRDTLRWFPPRPAQTRRSRGVAVIQFFAIRECLRLVGHIQGSVLVDLGKLRRRDLSSFENAEAESICIHETSTGEYVLLVDEIVALRRRMDLLQDVGIPDGFDPEDDQQLRRYAERNIRLGPFSVKSLNLLLSWVFQRLHVLTTGTATPRRNLSRSHANLGPVTTHLISIRFEIDGINGKTNAKRLRMFNNGEQTCGLDYIMCGLDFISLRRDPLMKLGLTLVHEMIIHAYRYLRCSSKEHHHPQGVHAVPLRSNVQHSNADIEADLLQYYFNAETRDGRPPIYIRERRRGPNDVFFHIPDEWENFRRGEVFTPRRTGRPARNIPIDPSIMPRPP